MGRDRWLRIVFALILASLPGVAGAQSAPSTYRWVDERGVVHYSQTPPPAAPGATESAETHPLAVVGEQYVLRIDGRALPLERIAINGRTVLTGGTVSRAPIPLTPFVADGRNVLEIDYASDPVDGLRLTVERRWPGSLQGQELATFSSGAGETRGETVKRRVDFTVGGTPGR